MSQNANGFHVQIQSLAKILECRHAIGAIKRGKDVVIGTAVVDEPTDQGLG